MIANLERDWKVTLLERGKNGIKLTSDGLELLPYAKNIVEDFNKLQMEIDELHGIQSGIIRIGTFFQCCYALAAQYYKSTSKGLPQY